LAPFSINKLIVSSDFPLAAATNIGVNNFEIKKYEFIILI